MPIHSKTNENWVYSFAVSFFFRSPSGLCTLSIYIKTFCIVKCILHCSANSSSLCNQLLEELMLKFTHLLRKQTEQCQKETCYSSKGSLCLQLGSEALLHSSSAMLFQVFFIGVRWGATTSPSCGLVKSFSIHHWIKYCFAAEITCGSWLL